MPNFPIPEATPVGYASAVLEIDGNGEIVASTLHRARKPLRLWGRPPRADAHSAVGRLAQGICGGSAAGPNLAPQPMYSAREPGELEGMDKQMLDLPAHRARAHQSHPSRVWRAQPRRALRSDTTRATRSLPGGSKEPAAMSPSAFARALMKLMPGPLLAQLLAPRAGTRRA
jgi:hypothetical protein